MRYSLFGIALAMWICAAFTLGQQSERKPAVASVRQSSPLSTPGSGAPQPSPEMRSLTKALEGKWTTVEKYEPNEMTPAGGAGHGESVFRSGPGGFTLEEEYHSHTPAGELFGFGIIWWDATKGLQHLWCINIYPTGCEMFPPPAQPGPKWDGKRLVLHVESDQGGKKMVFHEVISDITPNSFTQSADTGESGAPLKRWFTNRARKVQNAKLPAAPPKSQHQ